MSSKSIQRLKGSITFAIGAAMTWWNWHSALTTGTYYLKASVLGPCAASLGLMVILSPVHEDDDIHASARLLPGWSHMTVPQKASYVFSIAVGLLNWAWISGTI